MCAFSENSIKFQQPRIAGDTSTRRGSNQSETFMMAFWTTTSAEPPCEKPMSNAAVEGRGSLGAKCEADGQKEYRAGKVFHEPSLSRS